MHLKWILFFFLLKITENDFKRYVVCFWVVQLDEVKVKKEEERNEMNEWMNEWIS